jgi:hypothetical protein
VKLKAAPAPTALAAVLAGALIVVSLAGCTDDGTGLARQACVHVDRSIALYHQSEQAADATAAADRRAEALAQLDRALPLAAQANSANPAWNPLMTTLEEAGTNREANLIRALTAQCAATRSRTSPIRFTVPTGSGTGSTSPPTTK